MSGHFGDESFQAIDCTGTDNDKQWNRYTTYTRNTRQMEKPGLANKTN